MILSFKNARKLGILGAKIQSKKYLKNDFFRSNFQIGKLKVFQIWTPIFGYFCSWNSSIKNAWKMAILGAKIQS